MKRLVIVGGGFAGLWSALSAVRQARELRAELDVTLVSREARQTNRPRLYEGALEGLRWELADYCEPLGIRLVVDNVERIDPIARTLDLGMRASPIPYDSLVLAAGSHVHRPDLPGVERAFDVDTYASAAHLQAHLEGLAANGFPSTSSRQVVVLGAGFTGLELATALPARLVTLSSADDPPRVHLVDRTPGPEATMTREAAAYVRQCLDDAGVECHWGRSVQRIEAHQVVLDDGAALATETAVWTAGMRASPLTECFAGERDGLGRLRVNADLSLPRYPDVFVAGDSASVEADAGRIAPMSCQHAMPQGRVAGHNAASRLLGGEPLAYRQSRYVTCVDLGPGQALFTTGWERTLVRTGAEAKATKERIVRELIVPPRDIEAALAASQPQPA